MRWMKRIPSACATMTVSECARTSCSSLAILLRSCSTASSVAVSRSRVSAASCALPAPRGVVYCHTDGPGGEVQGGERPEDQKSVGEGSQ